MVLERMGQFQVTVARSGPECLRKVSQARPDLVLLDILMPGMDGLEVLRKLRSRPDSQNIPILIVSVDAQLERIATCFEAGANGFLIKPFDAANLYRQVRRAIARQKVGIPRHSVHP